MGIKVRLQIFLSISVFISFLYGFHTIPKSLSQHELVPSLYCPTDSFTYDPLSRCVRATSKLSMTTEVVSFGHLIAATPVCPAWGEPGWAPFCFLNGNPVFNAFDSFQAFIQNDIVV